MAPQRRICGGALLLLTAICGLTVLLAGCSRSSGMAGAAAAQAPRASAYTLMQMNLCLSGLAGCYRKVQYPAGVSDVIARIQATHPDAVTLNETCSGDIARIAQRTGYHPRFSRVIYYGRPLSCVNPSGRGLFGDAVLTKASIRSSDTQPFDTQAGPERRVWLCVSTRVGVEVCTAHLASNEADEVAANDPQCAELRDLLMRHAAGGAVIFGGDANRRGSCAPRGFWTRTDGSADQDPGSQHVYGSGALRTPTARVVPATHTDHDVMMVSARVRAGR